MSNQNKPILFFSKKCNNCITLWDKLTKENRLDDFVKICVDNNNKIPPMIREVPTIFINKDRPLITGMAIGMFLNTVPNKPQFQPTNQQAQQPARQENFVGQPINRSAPLSSTDDPAHIRDFNPIEMSNNWSDSYSFIEDNPAPLDFSFQFLGGNDVQQQGQSQGQNSTGNSKMSRQNDFNSRLEELKRTRGEIR
jgi:hypothetical protein